MIPRLLRPRQENATASFTCEAHGHCLPALLRFCALRALVAGVSGPETGWTPRKSRALKRCSGLVIQRMDWNQEPSQQMMPTSIPPDGRDLGWSNELKWIQRYEWDNRSRSSKWRNISQTHKGTKPLATLVEMLKISHISKPSGKEKTFRMRMQTFLRNWGSRMLQRHLGARKSMAASASAGCRSTKLIPKNGWINWSVPE